MARKSAAEGADAIRRILRFLESPAALADEYADAVLEQALRNAAGRPTPQAPMAARGMVAEGNVIRSLAGGRPSEVAAGSEFGSSIYRQFHAGHNPRGYWLYPAGDDPTTEKAGDQMLEDAVEAAIRGFDF